jgi:hypothetical protein
VDIRIDARFALIRDELYCTIADINADRGDAGRLVRLAALGRTAADLGAFQGQKSY